MSREESPHGERQTRERPLRLVRKEAPPQLGRDSRSTDRLKGRQSDPPHHGAYELSHQPGGLLLPLRGRESRGVHWSKSRDGGHVVLGALGADEKENGNEDEALLGV